MKLKKCQIFEKYKFFYLENDRYIGQRIALEKYEPYETQLILKQAKVGDVVVDVGANIGYYTVLLADKVGKNGKVYAFEPDKTNFEILVKNIKENNLKNVVPVNAAVGRKEGKLKLHKSKDNLGDHKLYETHPPCGHSPLKKGGQNGLDKELVKIIKLDDYLADIKVNLIKIDTQGWEPEVIGGAKELIKKNKPVIFLEYSPASYKQAKLNGKKMMNFLRKIYRKIWWIDEWLYIYKNLSQEKIDEICRTNKTGYADLWMKNKIGIKDFWEEYKDIKIKQWIKKMLFD
jgi:FkbM family methyltransferase